MGDLETGHKWWIRYVVVPLVAGGGIVAIFVTHFLENSKRPNEAISPAAPPLQQRPSAAQPSSVPKGRPIATISEQEAASPSPTHQSQRDLTASILQPDLTRKREHLESFPIDSLDYVGSLGRTDSVGLVTAPDRITYRVRVGDYIGQNNGRISKISPQEISIVELIKDENDRWSERDNMLILTEF